ncbi:MAG: nicotinate-nucleotide pyrophosphorylase (carboxylating) [Acidimicrobiales bacterium]|nr:nicotinate-nucleotide pyrophosphorylase (carboxylating) [Acidimicrobiales bacterium]
MSAVDPPITAVREAVTRALIEDLEPLGDVTSALLPPGQQATAAFVAREEGVVAGGSCALETFRQVDPDVEIQWRVDDGAAVDPGTEIGRVIGSLASILIAERTALNFLCHLSGVASYTRRFVRAAHGDARIWDTRKTTPGLRALEKAAVRAGGGRNHRGNLSEWVLLKDNHIAGMGITEAVARARERWPARTVQVEADTLAQVDEALAADADIVLLDNMTPEQVATAVQKRGGARRPLLEVSGGVTLQTVSRYAGTGVDLISVGALTHSAPILDIGLDIVEVR